MSLRDGLFKGFFSKRSNYGSALGHQAEDLCRKMVVSVASVATDRRMGTSPKGGEGDMRSRSSDGRSYPDIRHRWRLTPSARFDR